MIDGPVLALDTATDVAVLGVVGGDHQALLSETRATPVAMLSEADAVLEESGVKAVELAGVVVGVGPGRYTSLRIGLASARAIATALDVPIAGVSTLRALAVGAPQALAMIDARRGEVFALQGEEIVCVAPAELEVAGTTCVGDGATAYRDELTARGAVVPGDDDPRHRVAPRNLARIADDYGAPASIEPLYLRVPDAERTRKEFPRA